MVRRQGPEETGPLLSQPSDRLTLSCDLGRTLGATESPGATFLVSEASRASPVSSRDALQCW